MNFDEVSEFQKDVKALKKRVRTIESDIKRVKSRIEALYVVGDGMTVEEHAEFRKQFFASKKANLLSGSSDEIDVIKMRLDTDSDQFHTKLRLVFTAVRRGDKIHFIEIYSKSDKLREDARRIKKYI